MPKSRDAFRTISEVADWLGIQAHVLRFWESKFTQVKPIKRAGGRRYYRPTDMLLLGGIKKLLHDDGMTIKGVQKLLREEGMNHVIALSAPLDDLDAEPHEDTPREAPAPRRTAVQPAAAETGVVLPFGATLPSETLASPAADAATPDLAAAKVASASDTAAEPPLPRTTPFSAQYDDEGPADEDMPEPPRFDTTAEDSSRPDSTPSQEAEAASPDADEQDDFDNIFGEEETSDGFDARDGFDATDGVDATDRYDATEDGEAPEEDEREIEAQPMAAAETDEIPAAETDHQPDPAPEAPASASRTEAEALAHAEATMPAPPETRGPPHTARPRKVDLPPFTAEEDVRALPSALSHTYRLSHLTPTQAAEIAPLLSRLGALRDAMDAARRATTTNSTGN